MKLIDAIKHSGRPFEIPDASRNDLNRWMLFTWGEPFYFHKPGMTNAGMITKRDVVIECIENRYKKYSNGLPREMIYEVGKVSGEPNPESYYARYPFLGLSHRFAIDELEQREHKKAWPVQAFDIPVWGRAEDIRKKFPRALAIMVLGKPLKID